ncbi:MAG: hydroxysqualene dehydroxylase HpnE [Gemmatimonadota bacterium]
MTRPGRGHAPVVVVGGGLAGIAAALTLARAGRRVVLCERRPFLGGRAFSFADPDTGAVIDNGQHVLVGACARLRALFSAIGAPLNAFVRQRRLEVAILDEAGRRAVVRSPPLPAPLHVLPSLLAYRHLDRAERRVTARAMRALVSARGHARAALDPIPLGGWLETRGVSARAVDRFWEPLVRPALNIPARQANTPLAAFFFEQTVWRGRAGGALWLPATGLSDAIGNPAALALARAGVELKLGARVRRIACEGNRVGGVELAEGETIESEDVVAAVPPTALAEIAPRAALPAHVGDLGASPIVNVFLWYDRPVLDLAFAGTLDPDLQWVFDRERLLGHEAAGGHGVGISLSAADSVLDLPKETIAERTDEALARVFPTRLAARRVRFAVVKEPRATFLAGAGLRGRRPAADEAPAHGLWLAGDWTDTGWPATMEGAVQSGESAAGAVLTGSSRRGSDAE